MITYEDDLFLLFKLRGSVYPKAIVFAIPAVIISLLLSYCEDWAPEAHKKSGIQDVSESQLWSATTAIITILLGFRTRQAMGRFWEGTGLLHQMRGEWFDAASCLVSFSRDALVKGGKVLEVWEFRHTLIRLMSLMHGTALDEISDSTEDVYEVLDIHGLDTRTLSFLKDCSEQYMFNRVEALQHMIQVLVTHNHHAGVLTIPPPILSRIYQTLSRGLVNLLNAKKIKDTKFPFPYAQTILILILLHTLFTPVMMTSIIKNKVWAALFSFVPIFGMHSVNCIAVELEMPFGSDENDLPLGNFQTEMNATLLMLVHDQTDHLPTTSGAAVQDFDGLSRYARATHILKDGLYESNSKSFLKPTFFEEQEAEAKVRASCPSTRLSTPQPKVELKDAESKLDEKPGMALYIDATSSLDSCASKRAVTSSSSVNSAAMDQEKKDISNFEAPLLGTDESPAPTMNHESFLSRHESRGSSGQRSARLPNSVVQRPIVVPPLRRSIPSQLPAPAPISSIMHNCFASQPEREATPRQFEFREYSPRSRQLTWREAPEPVDGLVFVPDPGVFIPDSGPSTMRGLPPDLIHFGEHWIQKTNVQIEELRNNTDSIKTFGSSFPVALHQHSQMMMGFTEAVLRALDTVTAIRNTDLNHGVDAPLVSSALELPASRAGAAFPAI